MTGTFEGGIVTGPPAVTCEALTSGDAREVAALRCTGCRETFAHLLATPAGPMLMYRPVLWEHDDAVWWRETGPDAKPGHTWRLMVNYTAGACQWRAAERHALPLDRFGEWDDERVVLACRCKRRPHIADPYVLRTMTVSGGAGVLPTMNPVRRIIPVGAGECIDGVNRELFRKVQRRRSAAERQ